MSYRLITTLTLSVGCAETFIPPTEAAHFRSSAVLEKGQAQVSASAGGIVNELGHGNGFEHLGGQVGFGRGLELSLSGYDVASFSRGFCGIQCAGRLGLVVSSDRPEEEGFLQRSLAAEAGLGMGTGVVCTPLPPPLGPEQISCSRRPTFYGADFGVIANFTPHHDVSPYVSLGTQITLQADDGNFSAATWLKSAAGFEISTGRVKLQFEGGALAIGLQRDLFPDPGALMFLYYVSTGVRVALGKPPKIAPSPSDMALTAVAPSPKQNPSPEPTSAPASQATSKPASQPASQPAPKPVQSWFPPGWD